MVKSRASLADPARLPPVAEVHKAVEQFTPRERDVMRVILDVGLSAPDLSRRLGISPRTLEVHRLRLLKKVGVATTVQLVRVLTLAGF
jgi:DNA-binding CsgD family transcriptional regulator